MCLLRRLACVLTFGLLLASCASSKPPVTAPPPPLPAGLMSPCPAPPPVPANNPDAMVVGLKRMYDRYGLCAGRLFELQRWLMRGRDE